jgi:hypothetical protein
MRRGDDSLPCGTDLIESVIALCIARRLAQGDKYADGEVVVHAIVHNFMLENLRSAHSAQIATRGDARNAGVATQS